MWYTLPKRSSGARQVLGRPVHDNWWQTETGGTMIANFASVDIRRLLRARGLGLPEGNLSTFEGHSPPQSQVPVPAAAMAPAAVGTGDRIVGHGDAGAP